MKLKDEHYPLFDEVEPAESSVDLPKMPAGQEVMIDYTTAGLSLSSIPYRCCGMNCASEKSFPPPS